MTGVPVKVLRRGGLSLLWRPRAVRVCLILALICLLAGIVLLGTGTMRLSPWQVLEGLIGNADQPVIERVLWRIRIPRLLTATMVGASLGMAGAVLQSVSRNPLGSPDVIGFTTGAATGAIVQIILSDQTALHVAISAVLAGLATAALVMIMLRGSREGGGYRLVLLGIGVAAVLSGINNMLMLMGDLERAMSAQIWLAGSLNTRSWSHVWPLAVTLGILAPLLAVNARRLDLLEMGDEMAAQLGLNVGRNRLAMVMASVALAAVATASAGPIAFIGLAGPHVARQLTRAPGVPVLSGALAGAALLLLADLISQNAPFALNLPIGAMTALLGGIYLIHLLSRH